ncbi:MAG TPA: hypothetical protein VG537_10450 [Candidatus Kapabacteria bacterium]|nr:hypothetical protein [Candidatus Kapabacteria bacterium]
MLLAIAALVVVISSQHRIRLIVGSFSILDSAGEASWPPSMPGDGYSNFSRQYMPVKTSSLHGFAQAVQVMTDFHEAYLTQRGDPLPIIDDPDSCEQFIEQGRPLHCYNIDIGISKVLAAQGIYSRMWDLCGPYKLGGFGHNLLEVWDDFARAWKVIDPYYHCFFTLGADSASPATLTPVGLGPLRTALLHSHQSITVHYYYHTASDRPASEIISEYRFLAPCTLLHANNDFHTRYNTRYGFLMPLASLFDKLPLRISRAIRTIMLGSNDTRYILEDADGPHYPIVRMKIFFYALLVLIVISIVLIIKKSQREPIKMKTSSVPLQPVAHPDSHALELPSQSPNSFRPR